LRKILIFIDHFYPAYKGGGPIQSVTNLVKALQHDYRMFIVTGSGDLNDPSTLPGIQPDAWNDVILPGSDKSIKVWYGKKKRPGMQEFKRILGEISPDHIYFNGIFSVDLFMLPLLALKTRKVKPGVVICPRGMLQKGALSDKSLKKKTFLRVLKYSGLVKNASWHATNEEEKNDIIKNFPVNKGIVIAANIPKKPVDNVRSIDKIPGTLRLIYLSLIAEKKNLYFLLEVIRNTENIYLDIYGPVKDNEYWEKCLQLINNLPGKVKYCGDIKPADVQETFSGYHASVLLTRGENFGHALYESLSTGRPVITSYFTPWNGLKDLNAGWNVDISDINSCVALLNSIKELDQAVYDEYCRGAYDLAKEYFSVSADLNGYKKLFSTAQ
jgi:glycosyltransferase involved in cell wall biosynthesis